jgi:hypothetical protein
MSTAAHFTKAELMAPPQAQTIQMRSFWIGVAFAAIVLFGIWRAPEAVYPAYLISYMGWLGVTLGSLALIMLQHMTGGGWGVVGRRVWEAATRTLPLMFVLFIPIAGGIPNLYQWADPEELARDPHLNEIAHSYLNAHGFVYRAIAYFVIWAFLIFLLNRWSTEQDERSFDTLRFRQLSAPGLILYAFTISFAAIDWVMSLQARWISTIYGLLFLVGQGLSALCFLIIIETILSKRKPVSDYLKPTEIHDHAKLTLAFVMLWAYFNFSQWLIIWAGNLPEEITWYGRRLHGGWDYVGLFLAVFHFAVPFGILLGRRFKRKTSTMVWVAAWLMLMRIVDIWWNVDPVFYPSVSLYPGFLWTLICSVAIGGLWLAYFFRNLRTRPLLPLMAPETAKLLESEHE